MARGKVHSYKLGCQLIKKNQYERAIKNLDEAILFDKDYADAYYFRGCAKLRLRDYQGAKADFDTAIELDETAVNNITTESEQSDFQLSVQAYESRIDHKYGEAFLHRGCARYESGQEIEEALSDFTQALLFDPNNARAHANHGLASYELGRYQQAIEDYSSAIRLGFNQLSIYFHRATAYFKLGQYQLASTDYQKFLQQKPKDFHDFYSLGFAHYRLGNIEDAMRNFNRAIELNPKSADAYDARGLVKLSQGDLHGAILDFDNAMTFNTTNPHKYYNCSGIANYLKGDYQAAIEYYSRAIEHNSSDSYFNRGVCKFFLGDKKGAVEDFISAFEHNSSIIKRLWSGRKGSVNNKYCESLKCETELLCFIGNVLQDTQRFGQLKFIARELKNQNAPDTLRFIKACADHEKSCAERCTQTETVPSIAARFDYAFLRDINDEYTSDTFANDIFSLMVQNPDQFIRLIGKSSHTLKQIEAFTLLNEKLEKAPNFGLLSEEHCTILKGLLNFPLTPNKLTADQQRRLDESVSAFTAYTDL